MFRLTWFTLFQQSPARPWNKQFEKEQWGRKKDGFVRLLWKWDTKVFFWTIKNVQSDNRAAFLNCSGLMAYTVHAVCFNLSPKQRRYLSDHGHILCFGFFPVKTERKETYGGGPGLETYLGTGLRQWKSGHLREYTAYILINQSKRADHCAQSGNLILSRWKGELRQSFESGSRREKFEDAFRDFFRMVATLLKLRPCLLHDMELAHIAFAEVHDQFWE